MESLFLQKASLPEGREGMTEQLGFSHVVGAPERTRREVRGLRHRETASCRQDYEYIAWRDWKKFSGSGFSIGEPRRESQTRQCCHEEAWPGLLHLLSKTISLTYSLAPCPNSLAIICGHVTELQPIGSELKQCMPLLSVVHKDHLLMLVLWVLLLLDGWEEDGHGDRGSHVLEKAGPLSAWVPEWSCGSKLASGVLLPPRTVT